MWQVFMWAAVWLLWIVGNTAPQRTSEDYLPEIPSLEQLTEELGDYRLETLGNLDTFSEAIHRLAKLHISKLFSAEVRRYKRELDQKSANITNLEILPFNLTEQNDASSWIYQVTAIEVLNHEGSHYLITGGPVSENVAVMVINPYSSGLDIVAKFQLSWVSFDKIDIVTAVVDKELLWIALGSSDSKLVAIVCINLSTGEVRQPQNIPVKGVLGALHMFQAGDTVYLVTGERYRSSPLDSVGTTELYMLMGRYFDRRDQFTMECTGVHSVTGFPEGGNYIIIIGMNNVKGTHVYELDPMADTLTLVQQLIETRVLQVVNYIDAHDSKTYVIVRSDGSRAAIYWWDNSQLVQWQMLHDELLSSDASIGFITLRNLETVIFVADKGIITVYTDDLTGHYFQTFSVATSCSANLGIHGIVTDQGYFIYYICVNDVNTVERRILAFREVDFGTTEGQGDTLLECLRELNKTLENRKEDIAYLEGVVANDTLMTLHHNQVWSGAISFTELTVVGICTFTYVDITTINRPNSSTTQYLAEVEANINYLEAELADIQAPLSMVLQSDGNQTINGPINTTSLIAESLEIDYLQIGSLNGIDLKDLPNLFLVDGADQTITGRWNVGYLTADALYTRGDGPPGRINGYQTSELMQLSNPNQIVTGNHSYGNVLVGEICNDLCDGFSVEINGIDTSTIVTEGSDVTFTDKKVFTNLKVNGEVTADYINGVDLRELLPRVIFKNDRSIQTLDGQYTFDTVVVRGNVDAATINGIDFKKLDDSAVKTTDDYRIAGDLIYNTDLVVSGSLTTDTINGILWSDVVDLNSPSLITGMYYFKDALILGSLISNDINGLDFSLDVAQINKDQTINGRITFTESVEVTGPSGVVMEIGGTVNGVDPSELGSSQTSQDRIVIYEEVSFPGLLDITGDIEVESINGLLLDGILSRYWSKSRDQIIANSVQFSNVVFNGPVTASTLNSHKLTDYLHNYGNEILNGSFTFQGKVEVQGNIIVDPGKMVDGIDLSEFVKNVVTLSNEQIISGQKTFTGKVTVIGDLDLPGKLNGVDLSRDLLRIDRTIPHKGHLTFVSKTTATELEIVGDLAVLTLNGLDLTAAVADLVLVDEDAIILGGGGLQFTGQVKVNELYVSDIDGINLDELLSRALLKNSESPQVIDGRLLVEHNVEFLGGLTLGNVNGKNWTALLNNVVTFDYNGLINGHKVFTKDIEVFGNFNPSSVNGIDIGQVSSRILRLSGEQMISAYYTFNSDINTKALFAPVIDGVDMADILLVDVGGNVSGTVTFTDDVHLLNGLESDHYVLDRCDLLQLQTGALVTGSETDLSGDVSVGRLVVKGSATSAAGFFAGVLDFKNFLDNLVLKSSNQIITAPMQFGDVTIDNLSAKSINSIDIEELIKQTARKDEDNVINCDARFTKGLRVGTLKVQSSVSGRGGGSVLVNDLDLSDIAVRAVRNTGGIALISGSKTFSDGFIVDNIFAGEIGGVKVSDLVALSRTDILPKDLRFTVPVTVLGNLQVTGLVDGVDLEEFARNHVTLNSSQTMFTSCTFENIRVEGDLEIDKINDVLISDLVIKNSGIQTITGKKEFLGGLYVNGDIRVETINGINIDELSRSIVRTDVDNVFNFEVTFTSLVTVTVDVLVDGLVNGFDLSELNTNNLSNILIKQYLRIEELHKRFGSITVENYLSALEMYAELFYLDRQRSLTNATETGSLWVGRIPEVGPGLYLKITSCPGPIGRQCGCSASCYYYEVTEDAGLVPYVQLGYKVNILSHALSTNLYIAIYSGCFEGVPGSQVRVVYADGSSGFVQRVNLGLVADSGLFIVDGKSYIVTVSQFLNESVTTGGTSINVLTPVLGSKTIAAVWNRTSTRSAVDLDLLQIGSKWYLLVTNNYDAENYVDPYSAKSELYVWNSNLQEFTVQGEYIADHATSGMFISIAKPVEEYFFSLTQYKSAKFNVYDDNVEYTTSVLIYRYNKITEEFEAFQYLDAYAVLAQTMLRVDNNYYLILVSAKFNGLYVYQYYHSEGFKLHSSLRVNSPRSVEVLEVESGLYVVVTTPDGLERFKVKTKGLDPDNLSFYYQS